MKRGKKKLSWLTDFILVISLSMITLTAFLIGVSPAVSVGDETETGKEDIKKREVIKIDDVVVRGEVISKNLEATSATILTNENITDRVYVTPLDMLKLIPGVQIRQFKQGGVAAAFSMRGFRGCSHGSDAAIFLDGVPLNEGDGYADTNIVNPEEIERVEVTKGPVSALYGNYNSAGAVAYFTKKKVDHNHLKLHYGAYNTYEGNYVGGFSSEDGKWDHVYSVLSYHTDGYQDNSDWDKLNAAARITYHFTDAMDSTLSIRGFNSDWDAPGYPSEEVLDRDRRKAVSDVNGGGKDRALAKLDFSYRLTDESKLLFQLWTYDQEFWRWYQGDTSGLTVGDESGNLRRFDRFVWGSGASYNFLGEIADRELRFATGIDYMKEDIDRNRWRLEVGSGRTKKTPYWDYNIDMDSLGLYTEASYQVINPLRIILGARYDHFSGDFTDHLSGDQKSSMEDQDIFSPKAGGILGFFDGQLEFFANYSEGFGLMAGFSENQMFTRKDWDPQERIQYEVGVRTRPFDWFSGQLVGFRLETDNDFIADPVTGDYQNVGETTREGIELAVDFYAFDFGYLHCDYSYIDAEYDEYTSGGVSYNGNDVKQIPDTIVNLELGYEPPEGMGGKIRYRYESDYYLDDANLYTSDSWDTVDAQLFYRFGQKRKYMCMLDIINVFDEKYADYWSGGEIRTYSPGLPFSVYATFTVDF